MGHVNWLAVVLGTGVMVACAWGWYRAFGRGMGQWCRHLALLAPAALIGHNFARLDLTHLAAKPWLYWMMSGGFALMVVIPAQLVADGSHGTPLRETLVDAGYWLVAFLALGTVFWGLRP